MTKHPVPVSKLGKSLRMELPEDWGEEVVREAPRRVLDKAFKMSWSALQPLKRANKLGLVLFQFPPWFKKNEKSIRYIEKCKNLMPEMDVAVEFRNGTWLLPEEREDTFKFLEQNHLSYVTVDEPQKGIIYGSVPNIARRTTDKAYIRFHGRNKGNWLKRGIKVAQRFKYLYEKEELHEWVLKVEKLSKEANKVYIFFNNCFAYYALKNAKMFSEILGVLEDKKPVEFKETIDFS